MSRSNKFIFTLNNYTQTELDFIANIEYKTENIKYVFYGKEVGEKGTPHLQGYVCLREKDSIKQLKTYFLQRAHYEPMRGTLTHNDLYCGKGNDTQCYGSKPAQGKRTDLKEVKEAIQKGYGMKDIIEVASNYQSLKTAELLLKYKEKKRDWKPRVTWIYGKSGTGKTRRAYDILGPDCYTSMSSCKWWDGYDAHENVLIDDIRFDWCPFTTLLRLLDRYPMTVEIKGGSRQFLAKNIVITAPSHPLVMFADSPEDLTQIMRRIDEIMYIEEKPKSENIAPNSLDLFNFTINKPN